MTRLRGDNHRYKRIFGPVPSRRLGASLGVDLVTHKTCSLNCVYCECGPTTLLTLERREYVPIDEVKRELTEFLSSSPKLDYITFSGAGEPTLNSGIGPLARWIKERYPAYKLCLLTNGVFFAFPEIADELKNLDLVIPSLDAADDAAFQAINRPAPGLTVRNMIAGLARFKRENPAAFWLEIFVVPGVNDSPASLAAFAAAVREIQPDKVQLNSLDRPGCVDWVRPATAAELNAFMDALKPFAKVEIVGKPKDARDATAATTDTDDITARIVNLISRRPCTLSDLKQVLQLPEETVDALLRRLLDEKKAITETSPRGVFFRAFSRR